MRWYDDIPESTLLALAMLALALLGACLGAWYGG